MTQEQALIKREISARDPIRIVTVIGDLRMLSMSPANTAGTWVTDIEFGSGRPMKNIPVKSAGGSMTYAQRGRTVQLRLAGGRWQVIGPGGVRNAITTTKTYNVGTKLQVGLDVEVGFTFRQEPFEFYKGPKAMKGNSQVTFANTGGNDTITRLVGSWEDDGFEVGDAVTIQRTMDNDKDDGSPIDVAAVGPLVLEFSGDPFIDEVVTDGGTIGIGVVGAALWNNGGDYPGFPEVSTVDQDGNLV